MLPSTVIPAKARIHFRFEDRNGPGLRRDDAEGVSRGPVRSLAAKIDPLIGLFPLL